jgi:hypothetical protein
MTDEPKPPAPGPSGMQFERAESAHPAEVAAVCASCKNPLAGSYYTLQGARICDACHGGIRQALSSGSPAKRFFKAAGLGTLAALLGAVVYAVVAIWVQIGFVAIFVGWFVGIAVRKGSEGRGGATYQAMAMVLTYAAIVVIYVPLAMERQIEQYMHDKAVAAEGEGRRRPRARRGAEKARDEPDRVAGDPGDRLRHFVRRAVPSGPQNFIGLLLIGIALYEAWRSTRA